MIKLGYLLFCREAIFVATSNEKRVEVEDYIDRIIGFFEDDEVAFDHAEFIMRTDVSIKKQLKETKVKEFNVTKDMIIGYKLDNEGLIDEATKDLTPYIQEKTKPVNGKKKIIERSMYIVDCKHYF